MTKYVKLTILIAVTFTGCAHTVKVEPISVDPIHMTIDINVHDDHPDDGTGHPGDDPLIKR